MNDYDTLEFLCLNEECQNAIPFSVLMIEKGHTIVCSRCGKQYIFDKTLIGKIKKFEKLVMTVREVQDILGDTYVGINIEGHEVKLPYRLLLTRMNTLLTLNVGEHKFSFKFRVEPLNT